MGACNLCNGKISYTSVKRAEALIIIIIILVALILSGGAVAMFHRV